ncbi:hypothetical protein CI102_1055 [Trichoderma harzianum]|uniref:Uncharacterized protein n=1 Tax=Trichoderma harzianum CBS 226.95 TaxID=983964 RepID=A0A2T4AT61_TRIHA|nr:hypothetical protein M431DRAFT_175590 [Trichoderma harzianum CBS 226.95]PKK54298.1 hypothetical protein CI102_1055 [Trichoderma harzianum]PTB60252.1 hypothetical protein M431DRAFT_175590 [Trichoderma harzianum CBS 226.95]
MFDSGCLFLSIAYHIRPSPFHRHYLCYYYMMEGVLISKYQQHQVEKARQDKTKGGEGELRWTKSRELRCGCRGATHWPMDWACAVALLLANCSNVALLQLVPVAVRVCALRLLLQADTERPPPIGYRGATCWAFVLCIAQVFYSTSPRYGQQRAPPCHRGRMG